MKLATRKTLGHEGEPGRRACVNGKKQEHEIESAIRRAGFVRSSDHRYGPIWQPRHYYTKSRPIGCGLYLGQMACPDFMVFGALGFPKGLVIESKAQHVNGTADEKFPLLVKSAECGVYGDAAVLVVYGGTGARYGAISWLKEQPAVIAMSLAEFIAWDADGGLKRDDSIA